MTRLFCTTPCKQEHCAKWSHVSPFQCHDQRFGQYIFTIGCRNSRLLPCTTSRFSNSCSKMTRNIISNTCTFWAFYQLHPCPPACPLSNSRATLGSVTVVQCFLRDVANMLLRSRDIFVVLAQCCDVQVVLGFWETNGRGCDTRCQESTSQILNVTVT